MLSDLGLSELNLVHTLIAYFSKANFNMFSFSQPSRKILSVIFSNRLSNVQFYHLGLGTEENRNKT
jgi:hypothetical protein